MSQTLHKAVNTALHKYAESPFDDYETHHDALLGVCPFKKYEQREKWRKFASAMYRAGVDLINSGYSAP
jgi:hypothetical protein